jgi:hypothetical protein
MNIKKRVVIISAELMELNESANEKRTMKLGANLNIHGLKFSRALGSYKGTLEKSFIVDVSEDKNLWTLKVIAKDFNQESILIVQDDAARSAELHFTATGKVQRLGSIVPLTALEAAQEDNWTLDLTQNLYFGVK